MENQNPTGTHKDRSMKFWIEKYANQGARELAVSSSGNSAVSAAKFCDALGIKLNVFISSHIDSVKLARIRECPNIILYTTETPNKDAFRFSKKRDIPNLRASKDDTALEGYKEIAYELMEQSAACLPAGRHIDNIFIPTSSGATLEGVYLGYKNVTGSDPVTFPAFFVVQTTKVHPIASHFDKDFVRENKSYATSIVDNIAHRRDRVIEIIKETGGGGFVISNRELEEARERLRASEGKKFDFVEQKSNFEEFACPQIGWHSALAFAGFLRWQKQNSAIAARLDSPSSARRANKISVCIFTD